VVRVLLPAGIPREQLALGLGLSVTAACRPSVFERAVCVRIVLACQAPCFMFLLLIDFGCFFINFKF